MAVKLVMPKLGLTMTEGEIISWLKGEGDEVKKGDDILEIQTEKLTNTVAAPADGRLLKIVAEVGEVLPIAAVLAYIGKAGEAIPPGESVTAVAAEESLDAPKDIGAASASTTGLSGKGPKISPAAKTLAKQLKVDYTQVKGSGPNGRIVKEDILAFQEAQKEVASETMATGKTSTNQVADTIPYKGMRRAIGNGMHESWMTAPMVTHHVEVDVTELLELREKLNEDLAEGQVKIGVLEMFTKIVARALKKFPIVNSSLANDDIRLIDSVNIGIAIAVDDGLIVPVVKKVDEKSLFSISEEIKTYSEKARSNALQGHEVSGGTFTISNIGGYGSVDAFTPIINQPESAILGICRTRKRPAVVEDQIVIRSFTGLSFTFDHRVIDGAPAAEFLAYLLMCIDHPARAIFED